MPEKISSKDVSKRFSVNMCRAAKAIRTAARAMGRPDAVSKSDKKGSKNRLFILSEVFEAWLDLVGDFHAGEPVRGPDMSIPLPDPHLPRFEYGSGDRRDDCGLYDSCLDRFLADHELRCGGKRRSTEAQGQCPSACQHFRLRNHKNDREMAYAYSGGGGYLP